MTRKKVSPSKFTLEQWTAWIKSISPDRDPSDPYVLLATANLYKQVMAELYWHRPFDTGLALSAKIVLSPRSRPPAYWPYPPLYLPHYCAFPICPKKCSKQADGIIPYPSLFELPEQFVYVETGETDPFSDLPVCKLIYSSIPWPALRTGQTLCSGPLRVTL
ncbi:MAG: hypothetical protein ACREN0_06185 [Thermodesulfobacteriota bacterium]